MACVYVCVNVPGPGFIDRFIGTCSKLVVAL